VGSQGCCMLLPCLGLTLACIHVWTRKKLLNLSPRSPRACAALAMGMVLAASSLVLLLSFSACRHASGLLSPKGVNYEGRYSLPKSRVALVLVFVLFSCIGACSPFCVTLSDWRTMLLALWLHLCSDNFCFLCSSSSHDDQELPQGSSWRAEELGPRLCGSLQLDHGHLLSREPCHGPVSKSSPTLLCISSINVSSVSYHFSGCFHLAEKHQARIFLAFSPLA
jgi:hypothetical protein